MADAVEFRFNPSLYFDPADRIVFRGSKPIRLRVTGNLTIPAGMSVTATAGGGAGGAGTIGTLFAADGTTAIISNDDALSPDRNFRLLHDVVPGTYYIRVQGYSSNTTGAYVLHLDVYPFVRPPSLNILPAAGGGAGAYFDTRLNVKYRFLASPNLLDWQFLDTNIYTGTGAPLATALPVTPGTPRRFFKLLQGNDKPVLAARLTSSGSAAGSATITGQSAFASFTAGVPANAGDTALLSFGAPLQQSDGAMIATALKQNATVIAEAPGAATATGLPGFPAGGSWLTTNGPGTNSEVSAASAALAFFPKEGGWFCGTHKLSGSPNYIVHNQPVGWNLQFIGTGNGNFFEYPATNVSFFNSRYYARGAWLVCGAGDGSEARIATVAVKTSNSFMFQTWQPNGTLVDAPLNFVFVPYSTPGIMAGRVLANGTVISGTTNFAIASNGTTKRYRLTIPGITNYNQGVLFANAFGSSPFHLTWEVVSGGIDIMASPAPLTATAAPAPCEFYFAFIPYSAALFASGP